MATVDHIRSLISDQKDITDTTKFNAFDLRNMNTRYSNSIVDTIRSYILAQKNLVDQWNEKKGGVAWLNNEIGMFEQIYYKRPFMNSSWEYFYFPDIEAFLDGLKTKDIEYLSHCYNFVQNGGTSNPLIGQWFKMKYDGVLTNSKANEIRELLTENIIPYSTIMLKIESLYPTS